MNIFQNVAPARPRYSKFNLSHFWCGDLTYGNLVPIACIETLPGDYFKTFKVTPVGRLTSALVAPMLSDIDTVIEAFYVPWRLLMGKSANFDVPDGEPDLETLISGGRDGTQLSLRFPKLDGPSPGGRDMIKVCSPLDYLGLPPGLQLRVVIDVKGYNINALFLRAYRWIWNEYYRDESIMDEIQVAQNIPGHNLYLDEYNVLLRRCWRKDYFTSALIEQQHGTAPALPVSGNLPVTGPDGYLLFDAPYAGTAPINDLTIKNTDKVVGYHGESSSGILNAKLKLSAPPNLTADMSAAATFNIPDFISAYGYEAWLVRMARGGFRYTEILRAHFGVAPSDARLQRPDFLGSLRQPFIVSDVLQTGAQSGDDYTAQQRGTAISLGGGNLFRYRSKEFGYIIVLLSVVPRATYQQGIPIWMARENRLDIPFPEFAHFSEQAVLESQIFAQLPYQDRVQDIFGYQGIYNEFRYHDSRVTGHLRSNQSPSFDYWHISRHFSEAPHLDANFLQIDGTPSASNPLFRPFKVQDENPFIFKVGFNIQVVRPLPAVAEPGLNLRF